MLALPGYLAGALIGPYCGRLTHPAGRRPARDSRPGCPVRGGARVLATADYDQLRTTATPGVVSLAAVRNGVGAGAFVPANSSAVMKVAPGGDCGIASGMLRTLPTSAAHLFDIGMVLSFSFFVLVAARSIPRDTASATFVGTTSLPRTVGPTFTGLYAAPDSSIGFMALVR
jgi:hypothetical protein